MKTDWEHLKLEDICTVYDKLRKPISKKDRVSGIYPYYGASCIQDYVNDYIFDGRYLLIGEDGAKWESGDETAYIVEGKFWVNNHAHIIQCNDNIVDTFIKYYFNYLDLTKYVAGAIIPKLTQETLRNILIPVPSFSEQQRIVTFLDAELARIDALKANAERNIQNAKDLFQAALKKELEPKKGWKNKKLGEVCDIINGRNQKAVECTDGEYPIYGSGGNVMGYASDYLCKEGTTIIGRKGSINNPIYIDTKFWNVDTAFGISAKPMMSSKFVYYFCRSFDFSKLNKGTTIPSLVKKDLLIIDIFTPSPSEQQSIVARLDSLNEKCKTLQTNYEKTIALCDDLKQALLRQAFNGEI